VAGNIVNFTTANNFSWDSSANIGKFIAPGVGAPTSVVTTGAGAGKHTSVQWDIHGAFIVGASFANAGQVLTGAETWSLTQTGGGGQTISASGTFFSPDTTKVPEPATIALLGFGLLGAGAVGRRKAKKA